MNTGMTAQFTPVETAAAVAISGAIDHISQVTLLGIVPPSNIDRMYSRAAVSDIRAAGSTRYSSMRLTCVFPLIYLLFNK